MIPEAENYRKELNSLGYGRPVYDPDPGYYDRARIGDVGYFAHLGGFCRLFNVLYSENDPINSDGVPFGFVPMDEKYRQWRPSHPIPPGVTCRSSVKKIGGGFEVNNGMLPVGAKFALRSTERHWAALIISQPAIRKDARSDGAFKEYMIKNHQAWLTFARDVKKIEITLKDIVLVTGVDMTYEWATASAVDWNREWEVSFDVKSPGSGRLRASAWCSWTSSVSLPLRFGPYRPSSFPSKAVAASGPSNLTQPNSLMFINNADSQTSDDNEPDQCVFMRGYRMIPRSPFPPKIKAAVDPKEKSERGDGDGDEMMAVRIGIDSDDGIDSGDDEALDSQNDTYKAAQDYIFTNSDADFAVLHDDDVFKFIAVHDAKGDVLCEPRGIYINLETVNGAKIASLDFGGGSEDTIGTRIPETPPDDEAPALSIIDSVIQKSKEYFVLLFANWTSMGEIDGDLSPKHSSRKERKERDTCRACREKGIKFDGSDESPCSSCAKMGEHRTYDKPFSKITATTPEDQVPDRDGRNVSGSSSRVSEEESFTLGQAMSLFKERTDDPSSSERSFREGRVEHSHYSHCGCQSRMRQRIMQRDGGFGISSPCSHCARLGTHCVHVSLPISEIGARVTEIALDDQAPSRNLFGFSNQVFKSRNIPDTVPFMNEERRMATPRSTNGVSVREGSSCDRCMENKFECDIRQGMHKRCTPCSVSGIDCTFTMDEPSRRKSHDLMHDAAFPPRGVDNLAGPSQSSQIVDSYGRKFGGESLPTPRYGSPLAASPRRFGLPGEDYHYRYPTPTSATGMDYVDYKPSAEIYPHEWRGAPQRDSPGSYPRRNSDLILEQVASPSHSYSSCASRRV